MPMTHLLPLVILFVGDGFVWIAGAGGALTFLVFWHALWERHALDNWRR
jgi:hypothetical protein